MRAAFKALGDGKQVAILAPTTVLAFQHFETFKRRFQPFPVRVEMFSRFRSPKEIKAALADMAEGKVDIAIGTHRLLSQDVEFRDLGLVIVDEEQRFGVKHKERLKQLKKTVDVISMSATPIPRTLHMSLLGLRDMSVIETPPKDRLAIHTVVAPFQPELIRSAMELELGRGGQVYFLHNRVDSIWARAAMIQELVAERPHRRRTRPDGRGRTGKDHAAVHAARVRYPGLYYNYRKWPGYSAGEHHDRRKCRALRPFGAVPVARPGRPLQPPRLRLPAGAARYRTDRRSRASGWRR